MAFKICALLLVAALSTNEVFSASQTSIEDVPNMAQLETGTGVAWLQTAIEPRTSRVRVGAEERGRGGYVYAVQSFVRHPTYSNTHFDGNVALVRIQGSLTFDSKVQPARFAAPGLVFPPNVPVNVVNWGRTAQDTIWSDRNLYSSLLYTVDHKACAEKYASLSPVSIKVTDNMFCVREPGNLGTNFGVRDGGAPLFYNGVQVGFVTIGSPIGEDFPLVVTAVSPYTNWIVETASRL
ncbi:hypothetical protein HF086_006032 [Spodoptera exigua]|uniref:Peptidase S1 domain-containing protein n=1 Tax=Spodoptera exigua TaxID=7107 RepID=A0A922MXA0_SPOEX|nr:hypothetical protein HF086_006032 [Spodoptera exigua]